MDRVMHVPIGNFEDRLADPFKVWKMTDEDWRNRSKWDDYVSAAEEMFKHTDTKIAPWTLIPANNKLYARITCLQTLCRAPDLLRLAGWSLVVWGSAVLTNSLVLMAFHLSLPVAASVLVLVVLQPGIILPPVPARIGVFQYLCILALAVFGVQQAVGVSYGILLHAVVMLPVIAPGLLALAVMGWARPVSSPPEPLL